MPLIIVVLVLLAIGVVLAIINLYARPYVDPTILKIINAVVIIAVIVWLLRIFGIWAYLSRITV